MAQFDEDKIITALHPEKAENHYLNYHSPYQDKDSWGFIPNVECEIKMDKPLIYIYAKTIKN